MTEADAMPSGAGALNLIKLAVGISDPGYLASVQKRRLSESERDGRGPRLCHMTRNTPRRAAELLAGGSLYWVIKGHIRARQRLLGIETEVGGDGRRICRIVLDRRLVSVVPWRCRAFQGWRYLPADSAPPDAVSSQSDDGLPGELAEELRELGLL